MRKLRTRYEILIGAGFLALEIVNVYNGGGDSARLGGAAFGGLFFALKK